MGVFFNRDNFHTYLDDIVSDNVKFRGMKRPVAKRTKAKKKPKKKEPKLKGVVIKQKGFVQQIIINPKSTSRSTRRRQPNGFKNDGGIATNLSMFRQRAYPPPHNYYVSQYNLLKLEDKMDKIPSLESKYTEQTKLIRDSSSAQAANIKTLTDSNVATQSQLKALQDGQVQTKSELLKQSEQVANQLGTLRELAIKNREFDSPPTVDLNGSPKSTVSMASSRVSELSSVKSSGKSPVKPPVETLGESYDSLEILAMKAREAGFGDSIKKYKESEKYQQDEKEQKEARFNQQPDEVISELSDSEARLAGLIRSPPRKPPRRSSRNQTTDQSPIRSGTI